MSCKSSEHELFARQVELIDPYTSMSRCFSQFYADYGNKGWEWVGRMSCSVFGVGLPVAFVHEAQSQLQSKQ